jgi:hypothetical protein
MEIGVYAANCSKLCAHFRHHHAASAHNYGCRLARSGDVGHDRPFISWLLA